MQRDLKLNNSLIGKILLISDYDQTFYLNDDDIKTNIRSVEKFKNDGNIFVIATGRSYQDLKNKVIEYNFCYDYAIINHGATIIDKNDNILEYHSIENEIVKNIINDLDLNLAAKYFFCNLKNSRCDISDGNLTKINVKYHSKEKAFEMVNKVLSKYKKYVNCFYVTYNSIEIISNKTNKSLAINKIVELEKIISTYTIGDGYSDIEMVKKFNGYCMKNSVDELLSICNKNVVNSVSELIDKLIYGVSI